MLYALLKAQNVTIHEIPINTAAARSSACQYTGLNLGIRPKMTTTKQKQSLFRRPLSNSQNFTGPDFSVAKTDNKVQIAVNGRSPMLDWLTTGRNL